MDVKTLTKKLFFKLLFYLFLFKVTVFIEVIGQDFKLILWLMTGWKRKVFSYTRSLKQIFVNAY